MQKLCLLHLMNIMEFLILKQKTPHICTPSGKAKCV